MKLELKNKVAVILGGSSGLGKAIAAELSREGCVIIIGARRKEILQRTVKKIAKETGNEVLGVPTDVIKPKEIERIVRKAVKKYGHIDILINNAGGPPAGEFQKIDDKQWKQAFDTNFLSVVRASRLVFPSMKKNGSGCIINILSTAAKQPIDNLIISNAVRAGVAGLAKSMANEFAKDNIRVINVCPGPFLTDRVKQLGTDVKVITKNVPLGRMGKPEELGALVAFLVSDRAGYITGATIQIDGGLTKSVF